MKKLLQKRLKNEKGLTLVELLAVIVILGIIAAIAVPSIGSIITNSKVNALKADGQNVLAAANLYFIENGSDNDDTVSVKDLVENEFLEDSGGFDPASETDLVTKVSTGNTINGAAENGSITVTFNDATNSDINDADVKEGSDKVTIER